MKTLINPTDKDISVTIFGKDYTILANSTIELLEEVAAYWQTLHLFLTEVTSKTDVVEVEVESKPKKSVTKK